MHSLKRGALLSVKGWLLLGMIWAVGLLSWAVQGRVIHSGVASLLPAIPYFDPEQVPVESYLLLATEGIHALAHSPVFLRILLLLGAILLVRLLLEPWIHLFLYVFSTLDNHDSWLRVIWERHRHKWRSFLLLCLLQWLLTGAWGYASWLIIAWGLPSAAKPGTLWMVAAALLACTLAALLLYGGLIYARVALAMGQRLRSSLAVGLRHCLLRQPGFTLSLLLASGMLLLAVLLPAQFYVASHFPFLASLMALTMQTLIQAWVVFSMSVRFQEDNKQM